MSKEITSSSGATKSAAVEAATKPSPTGASSVSPSSSEASPNSSSSAITPAPPANPHNRADQLAAVGNLLRGLGEARAADAPKAKAPKAKASEKYAELDPEAGTPADPEAAATGAAGHGQVADLLGLVPPLDPGEPAPPGGELGEPGELAAPEGPKAKPPANLEELALGAGLDKSKLYDMEIITGDGETVKLGALKDAWATREQGVQETAANDARLNERETALIQEQAVWSQIGEQFNQFTTPEQRETIRNQLAQKTHNERAALMHAAPELNSTHAWESFQADAVKLAGQHGYKPHEVVLSDHRQVLILRGYLKALKILADLKAFKPSVKKPGMTRTAGRVDAPSGKTQVHKAANAPGATEADRIAGVAALIKG